MSVPNCLIPNLLVLRNVQKTLLNQIVLLRRQKHEHVLIDHLQTIYQYIQGYIHFLAFIYYNIHFDLRKAVVYI